MVGSLGWSSVGAHEPLISHNDERATPYFGTKAGSLQKELESNPDSRILIDRYLIFNLCALASRLKH